MLTSYKSKSIDFNLTTTRFIHRNIYTESASAHCTRIQTKCNATTEPGTDEKKTDEIICTAKQQTKKRTNSDQIEN